MITSRYLFLAVLLLNASRIAASESDITVVYWSAKDCTWCLYWESSFSGMRQKFEDTDEFKKLKFYKVQSERLHDQYTHEMFAPKISWVWDRYVANNYKPPSRPSWDVYIGKEKVAAFYGTKDWDGNAMPFIKSVVNKSTDERRALLNVERNLSATRFADIKDPDAVPYIGRGGRQSYTKFLENPPPRAFVIAPNGAYGYAYGSDAAINALANCRPYAKGEECRVYVLNDEVVWKVGK